MPIYEYQCQSCGLRSEVLQGLKDPPLTICAECGGVLRKLVSSPAFQFKGTGWYATDYGGKDGSKGSGKEPGKEDGKEGGKEGGKSSSKEADKGSEKSDGGEKAAVDKPAEAPKAVAKSDSSKATDS